MSNNNLIQQAAANTNLAKPTDGKATIPGQTHTIEVFPQSARRLSELLLPRHCQRTDANRCSADSRQWPTLGLHQADSGRRSSHILLGAESAER